MSPSCMFLGTYLSYGSPPYHNMMNWLFETLRSPTIDWTKVFIGCTVAEYAFKTVLNVLQYRVHCKPAPPKEAVEYNLVSGDSFVKSQRYQRTNRVFKIVKDTANTLALCLLLNNHYMTKLFYFWRSWLPSAGERTIGSLAVCTATAITGLIETPADLYDTFVIEQKFGFNKMTFGLWVSDAIKGFLVSKPLTFGFLYVCQLVIDRFGTKFVPYLLGLVLLFLLILQVIIPAFIYPLFNKFEPLPDGELRTAIEDLAKSQNFPCTKLYVMDSSNRSSHSNAFFIGMPWYKQIVLFDTLIEEDTTEEIVAVLAHELGHWKHNHIPLLIGIQMGSVAITLSALIPFLNNEHFYKSMGFKGNDMPVYGALAYYTNVLTPLSTLMEFVQNFFSRTLEYDADRFATQLGMGAPLSSSLAKLSNTNLSAVEANVLYSTYTFSHPLHTERLRAIKEVEKKMK